MSQSTLFLISVPIGNPGDISFRAVETLKNADLIIGEEFKETSKFLKSVGIQKEFDLVNEHTREEDFLPILEKIKKNKISCIISDAGTPTIEDPGLRLVQLAIEHKVNIQMIPGASAIITALALCGFEISPFTFVGFLNREPEIRKKEIIKYLNLNHTLVIYETPYRYKKVIQEISALSKKNLPIFLGLNLTASDEIQVRSNIKEIIKKLDNLPKAPPVIVIGNI